MSVFAHFGPTFVPSQVSTHYIGFIPGFSGSRGPPILNPKFWTKHLVGMVSCVLELN